MLQKLLKYRFLFEELVEPSVTAVDAVSDEAGIYPAFRPGYAPLYHYLFLLSKNVQTFISFLLTLVIFFLFVAFDRMSFTWKILCLIYPVCLGLIVIGK